MTDYDKLKEAMNQLIVHQQQLDIDGVIVGVSRQAIHEVVSETNAILTENAKLREDLRLAIMSDSEEVKALEAENARLREAVTPSGETKAAYIGEFSMSFPEMGDDGQDHMRNINVPWTTIKEIMAAISGRALTKGHKP